MPRYDALQRRKAQKDLQRRWDLPPGSHVWCYLRHSPGDNQTIDSQRVGMQEWCASNAWSIERMFIDWKNQRLLDDLSADVRRGLGYIVDQGYWPGGRPPVGFRTTAEAMGQRRNGEPRLGQRLVHDESAASRVALAWRMKLGGNASLQEIHEATRLYSKREHYSGFFANLLYAGIFVYHGKRFPTAWEAGERFCEPYITLDEYLRVQVQRQARTRESISPRRLASPYLLTGLLRCGLCEARGEDIPMNGHQQNPRFPNTRCYRCAHKMHGRAASCAMPKTPTWVVEEALATTQDELASRIHEVEVELHEQRQRVSRLLAVIEQKGMHDLLEQQYDRANARYLALTAQLANLRTAEAERQQQSTRSEDLAHYVAAMRTVLLEGPIHERLRIDLLEPLERIEVACNHAAEVGDHVARDSFPHRGEDAESRCDAQERRYGPLFQCRQGRGRGRRRCDSIRCETATKRQCSAQRLLGLNLEFLLQDLA